MPYPVAGAERIRLYSAVVLTVEKLGDRFAVEVSPPHSREPWCSTGPLSATEVLETLSNLGCHSTEVTDALYAADPSWTIAHDAEVLIRRRGE